MTFSEFSKSFRMTHDSEADAAYIYLRPIASDDVTSTIPVDVPHGMVNLDLDSDGKVVGIEILNASLVLYKSVVP